MKVIYKQRMEDWAERRKALYNDHEVTGLSFNELAKKYRISSQQALALYNKYKKQNNIQ